MAKTNQPEQALQFSSILEESTNRLWSCHFLVPAGIAKKLIDRESRRVVCTLDGSATYQCAILHHGAGRFVITVNKKLRDSLGISFGAKVHVSLKKDTSEYGLPIPAEFRALFQQDREGGKLFHALTPGKQRTLLYIVGNVKSSEKRIARAIIIFNHLKANRGKINYGQLSTQLKDPRHRIARSL
ncbi:MAG: YdeI/OmpD-associated family protein [Bacteroidota bacterium]